MLYIYVIKKNYDVGVSMDHNVDWQKYNVTKK